jgi:hypothetical protein
MSDNETKKSESESHSIQKLTQALLRRIREEEASGSNRNLKSEFRELIAKEKL